MKCGTRWTRGWYCSRDNHTHGPCALMPKWWNIKGLWVTYLKP